VPQTTTRHLPQFWALALDCDHHTQREVVFMFRHGKVVSPERPDFSVGFIMSKMT
jgi:hypothetical protein